MRSQCYFMRCLNTVLAVASVSTIVTCLPRRATVDGLPSEERSKRGGNNCPRVAEISYYEDNLTAVATVENAGVDPNFTLKPSNKLVDAVCPNCLNSSDGELFVYLGLLVVELGMIENITLHMSWELHHSWEEKCGGGYLTWIYDTAANSLQCLERPELVKTVKSPCLINNTSTPISSASGTHFTTNLFLLCLLPFLVIMAVPAFM